MDAARVSGTLGGSGELDDLRWYGVAEAMALDLAVPTRGVLNRLLEWIALSEAERAARSAVPVLINRVWSVA